MIRTKEHELRRLSWPKRVPKSGMTEKPKDGLCKHPHHQSRTKDPKAERIWNWIWVCRTCAEREHRRDTKEARKKKKKKK